MRIFIESGMVVIEGVIYTTSDELMYTRATNDFTIEKRGTTTYTFTQSYTEFTDRLNNPFVDANAFETYLGVLNITNVPTPVAGSIFDYVKCTSAGLTSGTGLRKVPLTVSVASVNGTYSVASDTITVNAGTTHSIYGQVGIKSTVQRPQFVVLIYKNGVYDGRERGSAYIRNAGISYDWWNVEFNTIKNFVATDTIEIYIDQRTGGTRGSSSTSAYLIEGLDTEIVMERKL